MRRQFGWKAFPVGLAAGPVAGLASFLVVLHPIAGLTCAVMLILMVGGYVFERSGNRYLLFATWLLVTYSTPYWLSVPVGSISVPPSAIVGVILIGAAGWSRICASGCSRVALGMTSFFMLVIIFGVAFIILAGLADYHVVASIVLGVVPAIIVGWFVANDARILRVVSLITSYVGAWGVWEWVTGSHLFEELRGPIASLNHWADLQGRAGEVRSEAAFGHSIALGGVLALGLPFALYCGSKLEVLLVLGGLGVTLSRGALISAGLVLLVSIVVCTAQSSAVRGNGSRYASNTVFALVASLATVPVLLGYFAAAGDELTGSTAYRGSIWQEALPRLHLLGAASDTLSTDSVDSAFLVFSLALGVVPTCVLLSPTLVPLGRLLLGRGLRVIDLAALAVIPLCLIVALITQLGAVVGFIFGITLSCETSGMLAARKRQVLSVVYRDRADSECGSEAAVDGTNITPASTVSSLRRHAPSMVWTGSGPAQSDL